MYNTLINLEQGGATLNVDSGGVIAVDAISGLTVGGVAATGVVKSGTVTLDGTNPTPVTTGLTTVTSAVACIKTATAPGDDPNLVTVDYSDGTLNIYAWKNTGGTDPTLVASTNSSATIDWIAVGN